jgi:hypothetical protein
MCVNFKHTKNSPTYETFLYNILQNSQKFSNIFCPPNESFCVICDFVTIRILILITFHFFYNNVQLVAKKNGNCQNKFDTFLHFFHGVKPSYERWVRINVKTQ